MAITRVGGTTSVAASITTPAVAIGDLIILWAYRDANATAPTAPTATGLTFTDRGSGGGNTNSARLSSAVATTAGTFTITNTNATRCIVEVYRSTTAQAAVGAVSAATGGTGTVITYPGLTLTAAPSWVASFGAHRTATNVGTVVPC